MLSFTDFKNIFDRKIFLKSKADLLEKIAKNPDRYVGIFRPTKPQAKLLQNLLQSNEIRFGDAFETVIEKYFLSCGWQVLPKNINLVNCDELLQVDQLLQKGSQILFIEQKIRDDHDSTKKRGQVANFAKKLEAISAHYSAYQIKGFFYFIDPSLSKNKLFYQSELSNLAQTYKIDLHLCYGRGLFDLLELPNIWLDIIANLEKWRQSIPVLPDINFDLSPDASFNEIKDLPLNIYKRLFNEPRIASQILPLIFPTGQTLVLLLAHLKKQNSAIAQNIALKIKDYLAHIKS